VDSYFINDLLSNALIYMTCNRVENVEGELRRTQQQTDAAYFKKLSQDIPQATAENHVGSQLARGTRKSK
jgi:hypothetical protein